MNDRCKVAGVVSGHIGSVQGMNMGRLCARFAPMTDIFVRGPLWPPIFLHKKLDLFLKYI